MSRTIDVRGVRAATSVVAAADSLHQAQADYVCDGSDDHNVINPLLLSGHEVILMEGNYSGGQLEPKTLSTLRGIGKVVYTQSADGSAISAHNQNEVKISNITFDGDNRTQPVIVFYSSVDTSLSDLVVRNSTSDGGLKFYNSTNGTIERCVTHDCFYGIYLSGYSHNNRITDNISHDNGYSGIELMPGTGQSAMGNLMSRNRCYNNAHGGIICNGSNNVVGNVFSLNSCWNNLGVGGVYLAYANCRYNIIVANSCFDGDGANGHGIQIHAGTYNTINNNTCTNAPMSAMGIQLTNNANYNTISGNNVSGNQYIGINLNGSHHNKIVGNDIFGNGLAAPDTHYGIRLQNASTYNLLEGNHYNKGDDVQRFGIYFMAGTSNNRVRREWFDDAGTDGAYLNLSTDGTNKVMGCLGYVTENSGTDTVAAASTSKLVTHGLSRTPAAGDIMITPLDLLGNATEFYISAYTATTFTISVDVAPGGAGIPFAWRAVVK